MSRPAVMMCLVLSVYWSLTNWAHADPAARLPATLAVHTRLQPRATITQNGANTETDLVLRRARLKVLGQSDAYGAKLYLQLGLSSFDMDVGLAGEAPNPLRDARLQFFTRSWAEVWVGLMKVPFSRERVISDGDLDMIDRSLVNAEFNLDRDYGVSVRARASWLTTVLGWFSGRGRGLAETATSPLSLALRMQVEPLGEIGESEGDLERSAQLRVAFGAAAALLLHAPGSRGTLGERPQDLGTTNVATGTFDLAIKWHGWALESAAIVRRGARTPGIEAPPVSLPRNGWGWFAQLGGMLGPLPLELVGRVASIHPLAAPGSTSLRPAFEVGGGVNLYIDAHDFKLGADVTLHGEMDEVPTTAARLQVQVAM